MTKSKEIDAKIKKLGDWRGEMLARVRGLIHEADPDDRAARADLLGPAPR